MFELDSSSLRCACVVKSKLSEQNTVRFDQVGKRVQIALEVYVDDHNGPPDTWKGFGCFSAHLLLVPSLILYSSVFLFLILLLSSISSYLPPHLR